MEQVAFESGIGFSTLGSWRRDVIPKDYAVLKRFATVCIQASPDLGELWLSDLLREAGMAGYREQALAEILPQSQKTLAEMVGTHATDASPTPARIAIPLGALPDLPDYYIPRPAKLQQLKTLILAAQKTGGWIAILGMTGVGKSTLMAALGHDPTIQAAFSGNVRWFEVHQSTTPLGLAQQIARSLGRSLPKGLESAKDAAAALRAAIEGSPVLLLLDNVVNLQALTALRAVGSQVVIVVTMRAAQKATMLHIPEEAWVTIGKLTSEEAWDLVQRIVTVPAEQISAAHEVIQMLECHPYITVIVACATLALQMSWLEIRDAICTITARLRILHVLEAESINVWAPLEMDWERLDSLRQYALTTLGRLPHFSRYDLALAQAVWGLPASEACIVWKLLVAMQLARPAPDPPGCYTVHWLIRDFASEKARAWSLWQRLRFALWPWRYPLPFRLRWGWPVLPKPASAISWPWWSPRVPGTEAKPGWRSISAWLTTILWRRDRHNLNLHAGPAEWVTVTRLSVRFAVTALLGVLSEGAGIVQLIQHRQLSYWLLPLLLAAIWVLIVTYTDLRRAVLIWGGLEDGHSPKQRHPPQEKARGKFTGPLTEVGQKR